MRAIVVGAGFIPERAGHGRAAALRLAQAGATVACIDVNEDRVKAVVSEIRSAGGKAIEVIGDMLQPEQADSSIGQAVRELGGVDVCVDIIGETSFTRLQDQSVRSWGVSLEKNLSQVFYVYRAVLPYMLKQGTGGSLTAIASVDGIGSSKYHASYGAAKAGLISLTKTLSDEVGPYGIRVNAVAPGNVGGGNWDAPDVPFGGDPVNSLAPPRAMDIANAILFLSSPLAARITGQTLIVDGGATTRSPWGFSEDQIELLGVNLPSVGQL
jgi:3-oxoacyl-[acyl-carrier protein] reductase